MRKVSKGRVLGLGVLIVVLTSGLVGPGGPASPVGSSQDYVITRATSFETLSDTEDPIAVRRMPELEGLFHYQEPWLGGDGVFSVDISQFREDTIMFVHGDTFWGSFTEDNKKDVEGMTSDSVSFYNYTDNSVEFHIPFQNIFSLPEWIAPGEAYGVWAFAPFIQNDRLYFFPYAVQSAPGGWFECVDVYLAEVDNPWQSPESWNITNYPMDHIPLPFCMRDVLFCPEEGIWYLYGTPEDGSGRMVVARTGEDIRNFAAWEFYDGEDWQPTYRITPEPTDITTFTVDYVPGLGRYILIYFQFLENKIYFRLADTPVGPWGEPVFLYRPPDIGDQCWLYEPQGHAHYPHFPADENMIIVSYMVHSFNTGQLLTDPTVYVPYFLEVDFSGFDEALLKAEVVGEKLIISPTVVEPGQSTSIYVELVNYGRIREPQTVELRVNGAVEDEVEVTLWPLESEAVTFTVSRQELGIYEVEVGGLSGSFEVAEPAVTPGFGCQ
jgi:hypothetical protein